MDTSTVEVPVDTLGRRVGSRRHRTIEEKLAIVAETRVAGCSVAEVARRHAVNANQVFQWRRQQDQGVLRGRTRRGRVRLLPVQISEEQQRDCLDSPAAGSEGRIEIRLSKEMELRIIGEVAIERVERVLAVLRRTL